jgi:cellulose synthase/poly-beta-1,6-N-acetylglucosamine synthase-like glycosyltransferase
MRTGRAAVSPVTVAVFWTCTGLVLLNYALYPLALLLMSRMTRRRQAPPVENWPDVSVLISARNEERLIDDRLDNLLTQDYPGRIEILVGSDSSTDSTDSLVAARGGSGVRLFRSDSHAGKPRMLQTLAANASGSILVFTDCDTVFSRDAIRNLVEPFADPSVGCVDGSRSNSLEGDTCESAYWRYERWIKELCSTLGAVLGATGAIYALRREVFEPLTAARADDFELAVMPRIRGWRCVFTRDARAVEPAPDDRRQHRRMARLISWMVVSGILLAWRAIRVGRPLLALQISVHKLLRWVSGFLVIAATVSAGLLWAWPFYRIAFMLLAAFHLLAAAGWASGARLPGRLLLPYYFWLMNTASMEGVVRAVVTRPRYVWKH